MLSFFLYESSRFYLAHGKVENARKVLNSLSSYYKGTDKDKITPYDIEDIITEGINNPLNKYKSNYGILFSKRFFYLSINSWLIWFISGIGLYITVYMLPQVLENMQRDNLDDNSHHSVFRDIIISNTIAIPKTLVGGYVSDIKFFGRIRTIMIAYFITACCCLGIIIDLYNIKIYAGLIKFMTGITFAVVKTYSTEAYPTKIRGIGYGTGHGFARCAGVMVPFICEGLWSGFSMSGPFYFVMFMALLGMFNAYSLPFETLGRTLDKVDDEDLIELKNKSSDF